MIQTLSIRKIFNPKSFNTTFYIFYAALARAAWIIPVASVAFLKHWNAERIQCCVLATIVFAVISQNYMPPLPKYIMMRMMNIMRTLIVHTYKLRKNEKLCSFKTLLQGRKGKVIDLICTPNNYLWYLSDIFNYN